MEQLEQFWQLVVQVWQEGLFGADIGSIVMALGVFVLFVVLRRLFTRFVLRFIRLWTDRLTGDVGNQVLDVVEQPIRFIPIALGVFFAFQVFDFKGNVDIIATNIVRSLITFLIFWAIHRAIDPLTSLMGKLEEIFTSELVDWLVKALKAAVTFIAAATVLEIWGIAIGPILAGLGLFGIAVALGAQDLFKNLIAGALIIAEQRFKKGDWVRVDNVVEGTVEQIGFRSTLVRRFDKAPVYVPNAKLSDTPLTNFSEMTHRRIYWTIGVEYRTTVEQLRTIREEIEAFLMNDPDFAKPPQVPIFVHIDKFSDSSIDIMLYCFTNTTAWGEWLAIKERLAYKIKEIVENAGSGFAFPSHSLYVEALPQSERPELFTPPARAAEAAVD